MRALIWLALMAAVSSLAYTALCLSAPLQGEAHFIEWATTEEAEILEWAMSSWSPNKFLPSGAFSPTEMGQVKVAEDSVFCPLTTSSQSKGTRTLWLAQGPEGYKIQEHLTWSVPFYRRGWHRLKGQTDRVAPMARTMKEHVVRKAAAPTDVLPYRDMAFVPVSRTFPLDSLKIQKMARFGGDSLPLWCFSFPSVGVRQFQWARKVERSYLDSTLLHDGEGWSITADTCAVWEGLSGLGTASVLFELLTDSVKLHDTVPPTWGIRIPARELHDESRTAPKLKTATLFRWMGGSVNGR
ncbi:MAG TPA: hypothetical protein DHV07_02990 [Flavobacteriales bacterium]|nr:hypothetical protein [Flavobacteriales bacterium]